MSQELAATRFLMEKLNAIESRLESIERILGDKNTSEDQKILAASIAAYTKFKGETISIPDNIKTAYEFINWLDKDPEPEWRPMSTAPSNGLIQAKIKSNGNIIKIVQKYGLWVEDDYYLYRPDVFEGWRPL